MKYCLFTPLLDAEGKQVVRRPISEWALVDYHDGTRGPFYGPLRRKGVGKILTLHVLDEDPREVNRILIETLKRHLDEAECGQEYNATLVNERDAELTRLRDKIEENSRIYANEVFKISEELDIANSGLARLRAENAQLKLGVGNPSSKRFSPAYAKLVEENEKLKRAMKPISEIYYEYYNVSDVDHRYESFKTTLRKKMWTAIKKAVEIMEGKSK